MDIEDVFTELEAKNEDCIFHKVQQYLILGDIGALMEEMQQWIKPPTKVDPHILRFFSHLILFIRLIGQAEKEHIADTILQTYVKVLFLHLGNTVEFS